MKQGKEHCSACRTYFFAHSSPWPLKSRQGETEIVWIAKLSHFMALHILDDNIFLKFINSSKNYEETEKVC